MKKTKIKTKIKEAAPPPRPGAVLRYPNGSWRTIEGYNAPERPGLQAHIFTRDDMYRWPLERPTHRFDLNGTTAVYDDRHLGGSHLPPEPTTGPVERERYTRRMPKDAAKVKKLLNQFRSYEGDDRAHDDDGIDELWNNFLAGETTLAEIRSNLPEGFRETAP